MLDPVLESALDPADVVIRQAHAGDLDALAALYVELAEAHGDRMAPSAARAKLALMLAAPGQRAVLMLAGTRPVGCMIWADLGDHLFIRTYAIAAGRRRRGLGAALLARLRAEVLAPKPLRLEVSAPHAAAFWEAQGFAAWSTGMRSDRRDAKEAR